MQHNDGYSGFILAADGIRPCVMGADIRSLSLL